ncbi:MAG TPA: DUF222 domain-containing protein [Acidimicrobiales bacterium]|nr:DUF222 domain-containing protein [Acidimicrobiales bacterium]
MAAKQSDDHEASSGARVPEPDSAEAISACPRARDLVAAMPAEQLESELVGLAYRLSAGTYELLVLVGELDARGTWADAGALSCEAWLAAACDIEPATAHRQVRVARAMREFAVLDEAMADGDVSYSKARILVGQLNDTNVDELVEIARVTPSGRLGKAIAAWCQRNEDPEEIARRQLASRSMGWGTAADGMVDFHVRLTPEGAAIVCGVVDTTVARRTGVPAGTSLAQQRADALVTVCAGDGDSGGTDTEIVIHVRDDGNTFTDGTPLADHAVTKMLPSSFISLLLHNAERYPIDASPRRRFPTRRQRRVVEERQDECQEHGCHAHDFLQVDHMQSYNSGGSTTLDNLQRLCGPHNRAKNPKEK